MSASAYPYPFVPVMESGHKFGSAVAVDRITSLAWEIVDGKYLLMFEIEFGGKHDRGFIHWEVAVEFWCSVTHQRAPTSKSELWRGKAE